MGWSGSPPGWYPDPIRRHELRYFNGEVWTPYVLDGTTRAADQIHGTRWAGNPDAIHVVERTGRWRSCAATIEADAARVRRYDAWMCEST